MPKYPLRAGGQVATATLRDAPSPPSSLSPLLIGRSLEGLCSESVLVLHTEGLQQVTEPISSWDTGCASHWPAVSSVCVCVESTKSRACALAGAAGKAGQGLSGSILPACPCSREVPVPTGSPHLDANNRFRGQHDPSLFSFVLQLLPKRHSLG